MKELNKKANWAIGLSVAALILVAIMFVLWCCNAGGFSAVSLDTFVGVIVALLAIIVTFVLGWQIYNTMELKEKISKIETLEEYLTKSNENSAQINYNTQLCVSLNSASHWESLYSYDSAFAFYHSAFYNAIKANATDLNFYIQTFERLLPLFENIGNPQFDIISRDVDKIKESQAYKSYFREKYDNIISSVLSKPIRK